jgi:osmotically-inducible protein OsmY
MAPPAQDNGNQNQINADTTATDSSASAAPAMPMQSAADSELSMRVQKELERQYENYTVYGHSIYSQDGVVTLQGPARTQAEADSMEKTVKRLKGVKSVRNNLSVEEPARVK